MVISVVIELDIGRADLDTALGLLTHEQGRASSNGLAPCLCSAVVHLMYR